MLKYDLGRPRKVSGLYQYCAELLPEITGGLQGDSVGSDSCTRSPGYAILKVVEDL